jgi:TusA-related sulfurtransferase
MTDPADRPADVTVDCLGRACPVPVIELARALPTVEIGDVVEVLSDDPAARYDIPAWCRLRGQEYVGADGDRYVVRRIS